MLTTFQSSMKLCHHRLSVYLGIQANVVVGMSSFQPCLKHMAHELLSQFTSDLRIPAHFFYVIFYPTILLTLLLRQPLCWLKFLSLLGCSESASNPRNVRHGIEYSSFPMLPGVSVAQNFPLCTTHGPRRTLLLLSPPENHLGSAW